MSDTDQVKGEVPEYELTESAYIDDTLYSAGQKIKYEGQPGYHMEPVNAAAKAMKKKFPSDHIDPILTMTAIH